MPLEEPRATHWQNVRDQISHHTSLQYQIGDLVLYDKTILGDNMGISVMTMRMTVGTVTAKINNDYLAVLM
jgi:hypothetical protein